MSIQLLDNLMRIGELKAEPPSQNELSGLIRSGLRRLDDAERAELSLESRFDLAYNSTYALASAALRFHGYRSESRYLVFQCLQHTVNLPQEQWRVLDQAHRKRNLAEYEGEMDVDEQLVASLVRIAREVAIRVEGLVKS
ncbi:MAG: hypothetical protein JRJ87_13335 [Deltaproteobacteria bacterium]|nr:hypothetical protein [Deltaproteobacteria bacterium]